MSLDLINEGPLSEARRQIEICNACRYCEGYCAVFPAMTRDKAFSDGDLTHLANLCHNCRGCYYACQYIAPHEFALNLPKALAEVRTDSWERYIRPQGFARAFQSSGLAIAGLLVVALAFLFWALATLRPVSGEGFYAALAHGTMVAIFVPAFLAPLVVIFLGLRDYWRETGAGRIGLRGAISALSDTLRMKNLSGGQGQGCNFEAGDRFSDRRRTFHQLTMWGFLLCFAATSAGTIMHYVFGMEAPYPLFSLPKLLGLPGGLMMVVGTIGLIVLKMRADRDLSAPRVWGGEMAFVVLLLATALTGLLLYAATGTGAVPALLAVHLSSVLTLFLLMPYSKMVHGFFRVTALLAEATKQKPVVERV